MLTSQSQNIQTYTVTIGNSYSSYGSFYSLGNKVYGASVVFSHQPEIDIMYWYSNIGISAPYKVYTPWDILNQTKFDTIPNDSINFNNLNRVQIDSIVENMNENPNISVLDTNKLYVIKTGNTSLNYPKNAILKLTKITTDDITFEIKVTNATPTNIFTNNYKNEVTVYSSDSKIIMKSAINRTLEYQITNLIGQVIEQGEFQTEENLPIEKGIYIISIKSNENDYLYKKKICVQ